MDPLEYLAAILKMVQDSCKPVIVNVEEAEDD